MKWNTVEGLIVQLLIVLAVSILLVLGLSEIVASFLGAAFGRIFLHAVVAMPAPAFYFLDGHTVLGYVAIILTYQILQNSSSSSSDLAGYAVGFGVVASVIAFVRYLVFLSPLQRR